MPPTFPLLRLPNDERLAVLRQLENFHLFVLSLISKRSKNLVTSANRKATAILVYVNRKIQFACQMLQGTWFYVTLAIQETSNEPRNIEKPRYATILEYSPIEKLIKCKKEEFEVKDWLEHLCRIFHRRDHKLVFERHGSCYDLNSVYENFKNPSHLCLFATGNTNYDNRVLKMIIPKRKIDLDSRIFENGQPPKDILLQNYNSFVYFSNFQQRTWTRPLDGLLCINSREISTNLLRFSEKDMNKFLKLWIRGSNPRLQRLIFSHVTFDYEVVLRGIQNVILREDQEKAFQSYTWPYDVGVKGGREIRRMDGTVARIVIEGTRYSFGVMPSTFPLFRLTIDERLAVLRQMRTKKLFTLSLISKRAENLVTSANRKAQPIEVAIGPYRQIQFYCQMNQDFSGFNCSLEIPWKTEPPIKLDKPDYVNILEDPLFKPPHDWKKDGYEVKGWLEHVCTIFHQKDYDLVFDQDAFYFDIDSINEHFKNPNGLYLSATGNTNYDHQVLRKIVPKRNIGMYFEVFANGRAPRNILIQNYESFDCRGTERRVINTKFPLDDLLCTNSREIKTDSIEIVAKDLNKFLKLWICGSNPRLERLSICKIPFNYDDVLRGIQYSIVQKGQEKKFKSSIEPYNYTVIGGRETRRMDGTVARIQIDEELMTFNLFIWNEHNHC